MAASSPFRGAGDGAVVWQIEGNAGYVFRAQRIRSILMREMAKLFETIDVYVVPSYGGDNPLLTNLTGHPAVVLPNGFRSDGTPTSITFQGPLDGDDVTLAVARAYQTATDFHLEHPAL